MSHVFIAYELVYQKTWVFLDTRCLFQTTIRKKQIH